MVFEAFVIAKEMIHFLSDRPKLCILKLTFSENLLTQFNSTLLQQLP